MKKVKFYFVATAILLFTVGAFAKKEADRHLKQTCIVPNLYYWNNSVYVVLFNCSSSNHFCYNNPTGTFAYICFGSNSFPLYTLITGNYYRVYIQ